MSELVLGPLLRYAGETDATIWVETDASCEVEVRVEDCTYRSYTFQVEDHHYALVLLRDLEPGKSYEYEVLLDGERQWPERGSPFPPSVVRTIKLGGDLGLAFGSCRIALPHHPPYTLEKDEDERGRELDALYALALRMRGEPQERWPHVLMLLGDQVYADEASPAAREFVRSRRNIEESSGDLPNEPPKEETVDFQEYAYLYIDSWSVPEIRWLLSTVSSAMIFDDHEVRDNWNGSKLWLERHRQEPWWKEKMAGALGAYWIYQHLGNLSPDELEEDGLWQKVKDSPDGGPALREMSLRVAEDPEAYRWSFHRDLGGTRLIAMDSRGGRILEPGRRRMIHDADWDWISDHTTGDFDHLLLATSIPLLVGPGIHYAEVWNDALCEGAWGNRVARLSERLRAYENLGHWSAFPESFRRFADLLRSVAAGERGDPPASIAVLSGDVHHAYLAEAGLPSGSGAKSPVYQAVCSPFRNPLNKKEQRVMRLGWSRLGKNTFRVLARLAGVKDPDIRWSLTHPAPWFNNQVATLEIAGRNARMRLEKTIPGDSDDPSLELVFERELAR